MVFETPQSSAPCWARFVLTAALLYFPVCGLASLPFGGAGRYLSVLAGPLALLFLLLWYRREWREFSAPAWRFALPLVPWFAASLLVIAIYPKATIGDPFSRVLWALIIALAAFRARIGREAIFTAAAIGSLIYCAVAVHEFFFSGSPRAGLRTNPVIFAQTAMLTSGIALIGAYVGSGVVRTIRATWLALGSTGLAAVAFSYSRGPMLAFIVLALLMGLDGWRRRRKLAVLLTSTGALLIIAIVFLVTPLGERVVLAWTEAGDYISADSKQTSVGIRLELWRIALATIAERPLLGYGYTNVRELSQQLPELNFLAEHMQHFHSDWFHALMAGGAVLVIGLAASVAALVWHARHDLPRLWLVGAMIVFGLTDLAFFRKPTVTLFIAAWALLFASYVRAEHATEEHPVHR